MESTPVSFEQIRSTLTRLRQDPKTRRKFPPQIWDCILRLTETHSFREVGQQIGLDPLYLRRKILKLQKPSSLEFQQIPFRITSSTALVIELSSSSGLKARIEGPLSCLEGLYRLFGD